MPDVNTFWLDTAEPRMRWDRQAFTFDGRTWDVPASAGIGVDAVTYTGLLLPRCYEPAFGTTAAGAYARLAKTDYTLTTGTAWLEHHRRFNGDVYLHGLNVNEVVKTSASWPINQGFFVSYFAYNAGDSLFPQFECGWGGTPGAGVSIRFWSDNSVDVYEGTAIVGRGKLTDNAYWSGPVGPQNAASGATGRSNAQRTVDLVLLPSRVNELLILSPTEGGGFAHVFEALGTAGGTIVPAGQFWWKVPYGQATVQCAPLRVATAGTLWGPLTTCRYAPPAGGTPQYTIYWSSGNFGSAGWTAEVTNASGTGPFVADGTARQFRLKLVLTGDGTATPFIYGAKVVFPGSAEMTGGTAWNSTQYVLAEPPVSLQVGEGPADVRLTLNYKSPDVVSGSAPLFRTLSNRPVEVRIGTAAYGWFAGRTEPVHLTEAVNDQARVAVLECRDRWKTFEHTLITDFEPLDGMNLGSAFSHLCSLAGYGTAYQNIGTIPYTFPLVTAASRGEWALVPEVGDRVSDWIVRLWEDYARTYYVGWYPGTAGPVFSVLGTAELGTVPMGTVWDTLGGAGGTADLVAREIRYRSLEPEANDIYVWGQNPRTGRVIVAHIADTLSMDPTLAGTARPENWLGERRKYALADPALTSQEAVTWAAQVLYRRLTPVRKLVEWRSGLLFNLNTGLPIWKGQVVRLVTREGTADYRVQAFSGNLVLENTARAWRDITYIGERLA